MGISIFAVEAGAPRGRFADDIVGRFRSGAAVNGRPLALDAWRVTTGDPEVAEVIAAEYGGSVAEWETAGEDGLEVYTTATAVDILLDGPQSVKTGMALWGRNGIIHSCDGEVTSTGEPCPMAGKTLAERKEAAKAGYGCSPQLQVYFTLADFPDLGRFKFFSGSWTFAPELVRVEEDLGVLDGPAAAVLSLEPVSYTTKKGRLVEYTKPAILNLRSR